MKVDGIIGNKKGVNIWFPSDGEAALHICFKRLGFEHEMLD
jgi:hypothetical protein